MGTKTCSACHGLGNTVTYETVPNNVPGGSLYRTVEKKRMCSYCGGSGVITTYEPPSNKTFYNQKKTLKFKKSAVESSKRGKLKRESKPDAIDLWFDKKFPKKERIWYSFLLSGIGAFFGYIAAPAGIEDSYTIVGAVLGFFFLVLFMILVKILVFLFWVGLILGLGYALYLLLEST